MSCFGKGKGQLPKIFAEIAIFSDANLDYVHFLHEVVYLGTESFPLKEQGLEFLKAVINKASNLEVLFVDHWGENDEWLSLDDFCTFLSSQPTFLSKFRWLTIHSTISFMGLLFHERTLTSSSQHTSLLPLIIYRNWNLVTLRLSVATFLMNVVPRFLNNILPTRPSSWTVIVSLSQNIKPHPLPFLTG